MSDDWIGRKIAELIYERDPMGRDLLRAAFQGKLSGRVYRTRILKGGKLGTNMTKAFAYDPILISQGMMRRLKQLKGITPPPVP